MKQKTSDKLEIFIITYNRASYLKKTLDSILDSPVKNINITILDNCSDDGTNLILDEYSKNYKNIKFIIQNRNIGGNANIVNAYINASKEYVWVLCDDDEFDWTNWQNIEKLIIENKYDAIMLNPTKNNLTDIFHNATFVPSQIYKTKWINNVTIENMLCNIQNFFPHLAIMASIINGNGKIYTNEKNCIITRGKENDSTTTYIRGLDDGYLISSRKNMFWFVGFMNSISMLKNKKDRDFILDNEKYVFENFFELLTHKIGLNRNKYGNSTYNLMCIFLNLNSKWRFIFPICCILSYFKNNYSKFPESVKAWVDYIKKHKTINRFNKICKNKKNIVIYGIGMVFEALIESGIDLNKINYICDSDYNISLKKYNIKLIKKEKLLGINPDCIIVAPKKQFKSIKKQLRESGVRCQIKSLIK